ncbi:MAG: hypothetical protein IT339_03750 [Thermomicrobiales bacterium]|nr:hypothetical protein [Thermomicrobiales bacterium]
MWRAPLRGFFLVLVVAGVAILSLALWARNTVYDENQFVAVVGGLSTDPAVQSVAVEQIMTALDQQIAERAATQGLSPTVAITYQMFRPQIESGMVSALQSPAYQPYWIEALRQLHGPLTDLLQGNSTPYLKQTGNQVQVNLYSAYALAQQNLPPQALRLLDQLDIPQDSMWITVLEGDQLAQVQRYVRLFNSTLALGIILSLLSAIAYVLLSNRKLRAVAWLALAIGVGLALQRYALELGRRQLVDALRDSNERSAAQVFYDTLVGELRQIELYALIVAVAAAGVIYIVDRFVVQKRAAKTGALMAPAE